MDYESEIDKIKNNFKVNFLRCIEEDCKDEEYINKVKDLICYYTNRERDIDSINYYESNIQTRLGSLENLVYKRPWNKLDVIQKKIKLDEFVKEFFIIKNNSKDVIIKKLYKSFNDNKLNSSKFVHYEPLTSKILEIVNLTYNKEKNEYQYN